MRLALHIPAETPGRASFVTELEIPEFDVAPDVVLWGTRIFTLRLNEGYPSKLDHRGRRIYHEVFAYAAVASNNVLNAKF